MLLDKQNIFSDNQNVLSSCYSTNLIYFGKDDVSYLPLLIQVVGDFVGTTTLTVEVETSPNQAFLSPTVLTSCTISAPNIVAGAKLPLCHLPRGNQGYMRLRYLLSGTTTAGKITAGIVLAETRSWHDK